MFNRKLTLAGFTSLIVIAASSAMTSSGWAAPVVTAQGTADGVTISTFASLNTGNVPSNYNSGISSIAVANNHVYAYNAVNSTLNVFNAGGGSPVYSSSSTPNFVSSTPPMLQGNQSVSLNSVLINVYNPTTSQYNVDIASYSPTTNTFNESTVLTGLFVQSWALSGTGVLASVNDYNNGGASEVVGFGYPPTTNLASPETYNIIPSPPSGFNSNVGIVSGGGGIFYGAQSGFITQYQQTIGSLIVQTTGSLIVSNTFIEPGFPGDGTNVFIASMTGPITSESNGISGDLMVAGGAVNPGGIALFDPSTGGWTTIVTTSNAFYGLTYDPFNNSYLVGGLNNIYDISFQNPTGGGTSVPEPSSALLLGFGAIALMAAHRRRSVRV